MAAKLILCRGLPGSGKSYWTLQQLIRFPDHYKRLNRDLLREMFDGGNYNDTNEVVIKNIELKLAEQLLLYYNVIVDDTNLPSSTIEMWQKFVDRFIQHSGIIVELVIQDFTDVPLERCIEQNKQRAKPVREQVIRDMYNKYLAKVEESSL